MTKPFSFRLIALLLAGVLFLSACGGGGGEGKTPAEGDEGSSSVASASSPEGDLPSGGEVTPGIPYRAPGEVLAGLPPYTPDGTLLIAADSSLASHPMLAASLSSCNDAILTAYGEGASFLAATPEQMLAGARAAAAGEFFADAMIIRLSDLPSYIGEGLLQPLTDLPAFADTASLPAGVYAETSAAAAADGVVYALVGDASASFLGGVCLLFNRTLLEAILPSQSGEDLFSAALSGDLTWERITQITRAAGEALAAGSPPLYEGETITPFGSTLAPETLRAALAANLGQEGAAALLGKLGGLSGYDADAAFRAGDLLFLATTLDALYDYPASDGSWGALPFPKSSAGEGEYCAIVEPYDTPVLVLPRGATRAETKGAYLAALCATAREALPAALARELLTGYIREEGTLRVLGKMVQSVH